jgi:hypothetical protein
MSFSIVIQLNQNQAFGQIDDLIGIRACDDQGTYYIQQIGDTVLWFGMGQCKEANQALHLSSVEQ